VKEDSLFMMPKTRHSFTESDVKLNLERFAKTQSPSDITAGNYRKWSGKDLSLDSIVRMFGSFDSACKHFGIESKGKTHYYSDDELLRYFEELWRWRKQVPSLLDFKRFKEDFPEIKHVHSDVIRRRYGDYKRFCRNFSDYKLGIITKELLIAKAGPNKKRPPISMSLRYEILKRDNGRCQLCGQGADNGVTLEVDHILPFSKGGGNGKENLRILCEGCNRGRSNRDNE
jgi:hypothetical protein